MLYNSEGFYIYFLKTSELFHVFEIKNILKLSYLWHEVEVIIFSRRGTDLKTVTTMAVKCQINQANFGLWFSWFEIM